MNQSDFQRLMARYEAGECTDTEARFVEEWAGRILADGSDPLADEPLTNDEQRQTGNQLWGRIRQQTGLAPRFNVLRGPSRYVAWVAAAAVLLILGTWWGWNRWQTGTLGGAGTWQQAVSGTIEVRNTANKPQVVRLEDGSEVRLSPDAVINYPAHFATANRTVYLRGEAFFDVKRNPARPFIVRTGELVTEVLGTSFLIKAPAEGKAIEVAVQTGRVSVYEQGSSDANTRNGAILTPNQTITYDRASHQLVPGLVAKPRLTNEPETRQHFVFEEAQLATVFDRLHDAYGIDIVFEQQTLGQCRFTGDLNELPLYTQLDLICRTVGATYQQRGTSLFVSGRGCE